MSHQQPEKQPEPERSTRYELVITASGTVGQGTAPEPPQPNKGDTE